MFSCSKTRFAWPIPLVKTSQRLSTSKSWPKNAPMIPSKLPNHSHKAINFKACSKPRIPVGLYFPHYPHPRRRLARLSQCCVRAPLLALPKGRQVTHPRHRSEIGLDSLLGPNPWLLRLNIYHLSINISMSCWYWRQSHQQVLIYLWNEELLESSHHLD